MAKLCTKAGVALAPRDTYYSWNLQNRLNSWAEFMGGTETKFVDCPSLTLVTSVCEHSLYCPFCTTRSQTIFPLPLTSSVS